MPGHDSDTRRSTEIQDGGICPGRKFSWDNATIIEQGRYFPSTVLERGLNNTFLMMSMLKGHYYGDFAGFFRQNGAKIMTTYLLSYTKCA